MKKMYTVTLLLIFVFGAVAASGCLGSVNMPTSTTTTTSTHHITITSTHHTTTVHTSTTTHTTTTTTSSTTSTTTTTTSASTSSSTSTTSTNENLYVPTLTPGGTYVAAVYVRKETITWSTVYGFMWDTNPVTIAKSGWTVYNEVTVNNPEYKYVASTFTKLLNGSIITEYTIMDALHNKITIMSNGHTVCDERTKELPITLDKTVVVPTKGTITTISPGVYKIVYTQVGTVTNFDSTFPITYTITIIAGGQQYKLIVDDKMYHYVEEVLIFSASRVPN